MVSRPAVTMADFVPQNVLEGTALERKQAPLSNVHDASLVLLKRSADGVATSEKTTRLARDHADTRRGLTAR